MAGVKGRSGRKANEQVFRHAILEKLDALDPNKDRKRVFNIAETLITAAEGGEPWAVKEVMDRVDGKPKQQTELSGPDGAPIQTEEVGQGAAKLAAFIESIAERSGTAGEPDA